MAFYQNVSCREEGCHYYGQVKFFNGQFLKVQCPYGHETHILLGYPKYFLLFKNGIHAVAKEQYMEAFLSIVKSWETFKEEFIYSHYANHYLTKKNNSDNSLPDLAKKIKYLHKIRLAERFSGAFSLAYLEALNKLYKENSNQVKARNDIIHGSKTPNCNDVKNIAMHIYKEIKKIEADFVIKHELFHSDHSLFSTYPAVIRKFVEKEHTNVFRILSPSNIGNFMGEVEEGKSITFEEMVKNSINFDEYCGFKLLEELTFSEIIDNYK